MNSYSKNPENQILDPSFGSKYWSGIGSSSLLKLLNRIVKNHKILPINILGHSDVAPYRKIDPGKKFPWKNLASKKIGIWHKIEEKKLKKFRKKKISNMEITIFVKYLNKIGYFAKGLNNTKKLKLVKSFQRRFRQKLVNGKIDRECLIIAEKLSKLF